MKKIDVEKAAHIFGGGPSSGQCFLAGFLGLGLFAVALTAGYASSTGGRSIHLDCWNS